MQVGAGPNTEAGGKSAYNNVQVGGAQHREIGESISTDNASWGGPEHREFLIKRSTIYN
ncbi:hypothetical protein GKR22_07965 [Staphylococcus aureus]|nr:hypothetical protein [Staphylococcus aureus]